MVPNGRRRHESARYCFSAAKLANYFSPAQLLLLNKVEVSATGESDLSDWSDRSDLSDGSDFARVRRAHQRRGRTACRPGVLRRVRAANDEVASESYFMW